MHVVTPPKKKKKKKTAAGKPQVFVRKNTTIFTPFDQRPFSLLDLFFLGANRHS
jgi:hypothetical protein